MRYQQLKDILIHLDEMHIALGRLYQRWLPAAEDEYPRLLLGFIHKQEEQASERLARCLQDRITSYNVCYTKLLRLIDEPPPRDSPALAELEQQLDDYIPRIRELMVKNFTGEEASRAFDAIRDSQRWMAVLLAGLLLMGLLMMFLLVRETRQHFFLSRHDPLTRLPNRSSFIDTLQSGCTRTDLESRRITSYNVCYTKLLR